MHLLITDHISCSFRSQVEGPLHEEDVGLHRASEGYGAVRASGKFSCVCVPEFHVHPLRQFDSYYDKYTAPSAPTAAPSSNLPTPSTISNATSSASIYGSSWMQSAMDSDDEDSSSTADKRRELENYLSAPREKDVVDIVAWWGVSTAFHVFINRFCGTDATDTS